MKSKIKYSAFIICALCNLAAFSQSNLPNEIYQTYDKIVGLDNTGLYNGTEFTDLFLNTDGTYRYFDGFDYTKGSVTYNGQYYVNVFLKYDLLEDNLLTRSDDNLSLFSIKLIPAFIEKFSIYNQNFVRLSDTNLNISANGFFEVAYLGNDSELYIKHTKNKKDKALNRGIQYQFSTDNFYVLKTNNRYFVVSSSKDFREIYPEKTEEIRQFYKTYKTLKKSNPEVFMTKLVKYLDRPETEKTKQ
ncbi:hypothetical protein [Aequorivita lipolytica]|uniref:Uncharacterized protein n=1 Tax=Aequorivita lipolytica TaxID=153267 RepID=A0A5C6YMF6_9FLAO|nr:hypothetical protein [Aequorivita lipolytica]TXD68516.1 hypothetical protein ESV24_11425 [Aequorivita lipolytica]SRX53340.1 hypothetical protein AEQU2_02570 [Aequorivita lipolytica]